MTGSRVRKLGAFGAGLAALGTLGAVGRAARAQPAAGARAEGARTIHLAYRAPATCPDEAALVARIRARVDVRTGPESDGVPSFGVTLQSDGERIVGRIASTNERREPTSREVSGTDCSHVVDAVALIVSMALAPTVGAQDARKEEPKTLPPPTNERPPAPGAAGPGAQWKALGSAIVEGAYVYAPTPTVGLGARLQVFRSTSYMGGPSIALGYSSVLRTERRTDAGGTASLGFDVGQLFVCPASVALHASVTLLPCARLDVGQLRASGSDVANARDEKRIWAAAGALGQVVFVPAKPFVIDVQGSLLFPLTPYEFVFSPGLPNEKVIWEAPRVGFSASLGLGVMFL